MPQRNCRYDYNKGDAVGIVTFLYYVKGGVAKFLCFCGKEFEAKAKCVRADKSGCGCKRVGTGHFQYKHGNSHKLKASPTYNTWKSIKSRCLRVKNKYYKNYGAKGIKICDRWLGDKGFVNFLHDVGERPSIYHTLDRFPNNKGNYEPGNVRWATQDVQMRNTTKNIFITHNGKTMILLDWARETGIHRNTMRQRYYTGWSIRDLLNKNISHEAYRLDKHICFTPPLITMVINGSKYKAA